MSLSEPAHGVPTLPCNSWLHVEHVGAPLELELLDEEDDDPHQAPQSAEQLEHVHS